MNRTIIGLVLASLSIRCDSVPSPDVVELHCIRKPIDGELQPFNIGNKWDYEILDTDGNASDTVRFQVVDEIIDDSVTSGRAWIVSNFPIDKPESATNRIWTNTLDGLVLAGFANDGDTTFHSHLTYPYPAEIGETFFYTLKDSLNPDGQVYIGHGLEYQVVATGYVTSVPLGYFPSILYERKRFLLSDVYVSASFEHFSPGIGLIAADFREFNTEAIPPHRRSQLIDYCLMQ